MKTTMTYLAALLMLGAFAFSCNKIDRQDRTPEENTQLISPVEMTFTATMAAKDASTRSVDADGVTTWEVDEKIAVYYQKSDDSYGTATANVDAVNTGVATISASLISAKNGGTVKFVYPASLVNATGDDIDAAKLQANQHGTIADISANFDAATGSGTLVTDGITCGTDATVTLTNRVLIGKFTPKYSGAAIDEIATLTVSDGTNTYIVTPTSGTFGTTGIYVAMLPVSSQVVSLAAETASASYVYPGNSVTLAAGKLYNNLAIAMAKDLSASATANTYMVSAAGYYAFNATVKGNGGLDPLTGLTATTIDPADIAGVSVLWELYGQGRAIKHNGSSYNISYSDGYVYFSTPDSFTPGDACVAIYDSSDNILWSWVIWATPEPSTMTHNTKTFMDRNLGAINVDNCMRGFLFEWGRKDAFSAANGGYDVYPYVPVASSVFTHSNGSASTMAYTVTHPTEWIRPSTGYSWMSSASEYGAKPWRADVKTIYDPCPAGWRIPTKENITGITGLPNTGICGGYDPSETYKGFGNPNKGYYWTASTGDGDDDRAYAFCNDGRDINHWGQDQGYAIRPVRE